MVKINWLIVMIAMTLAMGCNKKNNNELQEEREAQEILKRKMKAQAQKEAGLKAVESLKMGPGRQQAKSENSEIEIDMTKVDPLAEKIDPAKAKMQVRLLNAGDGPKTKLRYKHKPGSSWPFSLKYRLAFGIEGGPFANQGFDLPEETVKGTMTVKSVSKNGDLNYQAVLEDVQLLEMVAPQGGGQPERKIVTCTAKVDLRVSSRGQVLDKEISTSVEPRPHEKRKITALEEGVASMFVTLPAEAVGSGAEWEELAPAVSKEFDMIQLSHWKLKKMRGDQLDMSVVAARKSKDNILKSIIKNKLVEMPLTSFKSGAQGTFGLSLSNMVPKSEWKLDTRYSFGLYSKDKNKKGTKKFGEFVKIDVSVQPR
jgi:hypothetical protein